MTTQERIKNWKLHPSMRGQFGFELYKQMAENENVWLLTGDLGFGLFDAHRDDFPRRFINCGASEQAMMGIAVGLTLKGKIVFVYSITPFLIYRPFETIKLYLNGEGIPVKLIGSGRDKDYHIDGSSHDATDIKKTLDTLPNIVQYWPQEKEEIQKVVREMIENKKPSFVSLRRE